MKTINDYQSLKNELEKIRSEHEDNFSCLHKALDATFICISAVGMDWRQAKKLGMKKDPYYKWVFYQTSANSNGYNLMEKLSAACKDYSLMITETQL